MQDNNIKEELNKKILDLKKASKIDKIKICSEIIDLSYKSHPEIILDYFDQLIELVENYIAFDPNLNKDIKYQLSSAFSILFIRIRNMSDLSAFEKYYPVFNRFEPFITDSVITAQIFQYFGYLFWLKGDLKSALKYLKESLTMIDKTESNAVPERYTNIGYIYEYKGDFKQAEHFYIQGLDYAKMTSSDQALKLAYEALGRLNLCTGKYDLAIDYFENALSLYDKEKLLINKVVILSNIAMCNYRKGNNNKALDILLTINTEWVKRLNPELYYSILANIGAVHAQRNNFQESKRFNISVLNYAEKNNILPLITSSLHSIGHCNWKLKKHKEAIKLLTSALDYAYKIDSSKKIILIKDTLGKIYLELDDYNAAINYFLAIDNESEQTSETDVALALKRNIAFCYEKLGDYEKAYFTLKKHNIINAKYKESLQVKDKEISEKQIIISGQKGHYLFSKGTSVISQELSKKIGHPIIGNSKEITELIEKAILASKNKNLNVLLLGESGTGKESIAKLIHYLSQRSRYPFIEVNSAVFTTGLSESSLFGHLKGAYTGATSDHTGYFESADKGSLFFDEIADMPLEIQSMLLRVLETKCVTPISSNSKRMIDFRLICASNKNLFQLSQENKFRFDLYQRINTLEITLSPLRERASDIPLLVDYYLNLFSQEMNIKLPKISKPALNKLCSYQYPGNIRELKNIIQRILLFTSNNEITKDDIFFPNLEAKSKNLEDVNLNLEENEIKKIKIAMSRSNNTITNAANLLGISSYALSRRIKKYNIKLVYSK